MRQQNDTPSDAPIPAERDFPHYPQSWYPICSAQEISRKPVFKKFLGKALVAFRTESGQVAVLDAYCSHMGASLAGGCVKGETIQCPYHGWTYGTDGKCVDSPGTAQIPQFAKQVAYPTLERHGMVFFFNGRQALFDLPFFLNEKASDYIAGGRFTLEGEAPWFMMGAHAFDRRHLEMVHERHLQTSLQIDEPVAFARRAKHESLIAGSNLFDRLLRVFLGKRVAISMTVFSGSFIMVTGDFERFARSRFFLNVIPVSPTYTRIEGLIFKKKSRIPFFDRFISPIQFRVRRWFTAGYLRNEAESIGHHSYRPTALTAEDGELKEYFRWLARICKQGTSAETEPHVASENSSRNDHPVRQLAR